MDGENKHMGRGTHIIKAVFALAPFAMIAVCAVLYFTLFRNVTVADLLKYTPENVFLAALVIIGMFSLKSLTFFFPMLVLIAACGSAMPHLWIAVLVNTIGLFCMINIPYLIGRFAQREFVEKIINKHKKMQDVRSLQMSNETFFVFFLRIISCLPYDVVSMFLGSSGTSWKKYVIGSMAGTMPSMILSTIMGQYMDDMSSPGFIVPLAINVIISVTFGITYILYARKMKKEKGSTPK